MLARALSSVSIIPVIAFSCGMMALGASCTTAESPASTADASAVASDETMRCSEPGCSLDRAMFVADADGMPPIGKQMRAVPAATSAGVPQGFKVFGLRSGAAAYEVGLRNGDVVKRINDIDLRASSSTLGPALAKEVGTAARLDVVFERDGSDRSISFELRG